MQLKQRWYEYRLNINQGAELRYFDNWVDAIFLAKQLSYAGTVYIDIVDFRTNTAIGPWYSVANGKVAKHGEEMLHAA